MRGFTALDRGGSRSALSDVWVVIPAYNEASVLTGSIQDLLRLGVSVVVVDDGSADDTAAVARVAGALVLRHPVNLGQGASLQTGIDFALSRGARVLVSFDADGQHLARDVPALLAALDEGADVALGSRFSGHIEGASRGRILFLQSVVLVSNTLSGLRLTDAHCGLRAFRASSSAALRLSQPRMAHASEFLRNVKRANLRVVEVPVTIRYTGYSHSKGQRPRDALRILFDLLFGPGR
jgi:glycosyltransferase involved in cell wall biosynthesis